MSLTIILSHPLVPSFVRLFCALVSKIPCFFFFFVEAPNMHFNNMSKPSHLSLGPPLASRRCMNATDTSVVSMTESLKEVALTNISPSNSSSNKHRATEARRRYLSGCSQSNPLYRPRPSLQSTKKQQPNRRRILRRLVRDRWANFRTSGNKLRV